MLRIRFHGRGGQGMKTASRILGSAAFHAGFFVQDSPIYGAERRGAPMAAFTRIAREPVLERGAIETPDLVVVADDALLGDPGVSLLSGCSATSTLLINSTRDARALDLPAGRGDRVVTVDFTSRALERTRTLAGLSTALGAAASRLVGLQASDVLAGLEDELREAHLGGKDLEANRVLASEVCELARGWEPIQESADGFFSPAELVEVAFEPPRWSAPSIYAVANSPERRTGNWRQFRPVLEPELCTRCWICFVWCPDGAIHLATDESPVIDYEVCKGCLLCAHECPTHALRVEKEMR